MGAHIASVGDQFIWITSILAGLALLGTAYRFVASRLLSEHDVALLGNWYSYAYFQSRKGPCFYKEIVGIRRDIFFPWRLVSQASPLSDGTPTVYRGFVKSRPPFLYGQYFEPIYHDRTFEVFRRVMDTTTHDADTFVGIHLGGTYDEITHTACAMLLTRRQLDPRASSIKSADAEVEKARFAEIVQPYFILDPESFQLLLS